MTEAGQGGRDEEERWGRRLVDVDALARSVPVPELEQDEWEQLPLYDSAADSN